MIDRRCISWSRIVAAALAAAALSSCGSDSDSSSAAAPQKDSGRIPIIVSSFEALTGRPQNNTELVAQVLPEHMPSFEIIPCPSLPMVYETAPERLVRCFEANPDAKAVLSLGEGEKQLELEQFTSNLDDDATADNKGEVRRKKTIVAGGERYLRLTLPGEELFKASTPANSPVKLAYDKDKGRMGNFVGNHVAYTFAHYLVEKKSKVPYGFITVPNAMSPEAGHNPYEIARAIGHILEQGLKPALVVAAAQFPADVGDVVSTDDGKDGKDSKEEPAQNGKDGKDSDQDQDQGKDGKNSSQTDGKDSSQTNQGQKDDKNSSQTDQGQKDDGKQEPAKNDSQQDSGKQEPAKNDKGQTDPAQKDDGKQEPAKDDSQQNSGKQEPAKNDKGQQDSGKQEPAQDKDSGKQEPAQDDKGQQGKQQDQHQQKSGEKGQEKSEESKKETATA